MKHTSIDVLSSYKRISFWFKLILHLTDCIQLRILGNLLPDKTDGRITSIKLNIILFLAILSLSTDYYNDVRLTLTEQVFVILYFYESAAFL